MICWFYLTTNCKQCSVISLASSDFFTVSAGVETVRPDPVSNKLTLIGFMDPVKVAEKLQRKSKKKVELISPKPKKETKEKNEKKANDKTQAVV